MSDASEPRRPFDRSPLWRELVGDELRARRLERKETLVETSRRAGVSPQYLSELERGMKDPSSEMLAAVSGALEMELVDLTSAVTESLQGRAAVRVSAASRSAFALAA